MATQVEVGEHIDLSSRRVRDLLKQGVLPAPKGRGGYDIEACRLAYIRYLRGIASGQADEEGGLSLVSERAALAREQTKGHQLRNAVIERELIPLSEIQPHLTKYVAAMRNRIRSVPNRAGQSIPHLTPEEVQVLVELHDGALTEFSNDLMGLCAEEPGPGSGARGSAAAASNAEPVG